MLNSQRKNISIWQTDEKNVWAVMVAKIHGELTRRFLSRMDEVTRVKNLYGGLPDNLFLIWVDHRCEDNHWSDLQAAVLDFGNCLGNAERECSRIEKQAERASWSRAVPRICPSIRPINVLTYCKKWDEIVIRVWQED